MAKKKGKKKEKVKQPQITKTQYIEQISEKNAVLAQMRKKTEAIEDAYFLAENNYEKVQEDLADISKYLNHEIQSSEQEIIEFDEKILVLKDEIKKTDEHYNSLFNTAEFDFQDKNKTLEGQIQVLRTKLFASEETKHQKEEYLKRKMDTENKIKEMEILHSKDIYEAEKLAIIKQDMMQKDMESHLTSLAQDFTQASDIAIGETTNKLIRTNISLGNMIKCMQDTIEKVRSKSFAAQSEEKNYKYNEELLDDELSAITKIYKSKVNTVELILKSCDEITERIHLSESLKKINRRLRRIIEENECILIEKNEELNDAEKVLEENVDVVSNIENTFNNTRKNVLKLERVIYDIMKKVKQGIDTDNIALEERKDEPLFEMDKEELKELLIENRFKIRENAIEEILNILSMNVAELQLANVSSESFLSSFKEISKTEF